MPSYHAALLEELGHDIHTGQLVTHQRLKLVSAGEDDAPLGLHRN